MIHIKVKMRKNLMALLGNTGSDLGASSSSSDGRVTEKRVDLEKEMARLSIDLQGRGNTVKSDGDPSSGRCKPLNFKLTL